jgi:hypothetical protein
MRLSLSLAYVTIVECSPGSTTPDASTDGSSEDAGMDAPFDATLDSASDSATDAIPDAPFDAGACSLAPVDGGACNALTTSGSGITPTCVSATPPTAVGGPIYNGRYVLTAIQYYNYPLACPTEVQKIDWSICGTAWETVQVSGAQAASHLNATVTSASPALSIQLTCSGSSTSNWHYDATSTGIVFYLPSQGLDGGAGARADTYIRM